MVRQLSARGLSIGRRLLSVIMITSLGGAAIVPAVTPEADALFDLGGLILFDSDAVTPDNPEGDSEIYVVRPSGFGLKPLTHNAADDYNPSWSPDGKRIIFSSGRDGILAPGDDFPANELYVMRADGSQQARLTNDVAHDDSPEWSPDGRRIAFSSNRHDPGQPYTSIYVMDADVSDITRVTTAPAPNEDRRPSWSPDGARLVFEREDNGFVPFEEIEVYVVDADGSGETNITNDRTTQDLEAAWSPRGDRIAFSRATEPSGTYQIYTISPDGSGLTQLTDAPGNNDFAPVWSPKGRRIAFVRRESPAPYGDVHVMRANGSGARQVTDEGIAYVTADWGKKGLLGLLARDDSAKQGKDERNKDRHDKKKDKKQKPRDKHRGGGKHGKRR